jgi:hypothetical protein
MNARPLRRFLFRLAGHLKMTVGELCRRMDSRELSEWIAYDRYYEPIGDQWLQTGVVTSAVIATVAGRKAPKPQDIVPIDKRAPMHPSQIEAELRRMHEDMNG